VRLAAVVALMAMITLGASVVSVVLAHLGDLIVAFVCVLVVACCGSFALIRHGLRRLLGLAGALRGLIGVLRQLGVDGLLLTPDVAGATVSLESNGGPRMTALDQHVKLGRCSKLAAATLFACLATALLAASAPAQPTGTTNTPAAALQKDVDALVAAGVPGAILLVRDGDRTVRFTGGQGDVARKTPMNASDHFKIASLTKTYTATVVLQLVAEGKLRLADSVERWLPGLVPNGDNVTLRQLLNHLSGIPDYESDPRYLKPYLSGDLGFYWAPRKLVKLAVSHPPLFPPGVTKHTSYSNTNYVLLGLVVEAATGHSIGAELRSRIFRPLQLDKTTYQAKPGLPSPYAHGYLVVGKPPATDVTGLSPSLSPASGAIVSTADDVADFYRALLSGRLLRPDLLRAMKTTISEGTHVDVAGQRYGLGLELFPTSCGNALGHNGVIPGYTTFVFSSGDGGRQALLMVNLDAGSFPKAAGPRFFRLIDKAYCSNA
jgi:D-alanyl-D-alanine carboxypeptidase